MHIAFVLGNRRKTVDRTGIGANNFRKSPYHSAEIETTFSRQKSYADPKRKDVSFSSGDLVFLKVSPMKGVMRFGKKDKLAPRYIGPFEIKSRVGEVAYKLVLPPELSRIHPVFHVSMLRKYIPDPSHVLQPQTVEISEDLTYEEYLVAITGSSASNQGDSYGESSMQ